MVRSAKNQLCIYGVLASVLFALPSRADEPAGPTATDVPASRDLSHRRARPGASGRHARRGDANDVSGLPDRPAGDVRRDADRLQRAR